MTGGRSFVLSVRSVPEGKYIKQYVLSVTYSYSSPFHHFHFIHLMCMGDYGSRISISDYGTNVTERTKPHFKGRRETMVHYPSLPELKKALGANYSICTIDLEKCLYRDFGNGFNVEISGCSRANRKCPATLYFWYGDRAPDCIIVKTVRDVGRSAEAIDEAVEQLFDYSNQLLASGYTDRDKLFWLKHNS